MFSNTTVPADNSPKDQIVPLNVWNVTSHGTAFDPNETPVAYSDNAQSLILSGSPGSGNQPALVVTPSSATVNVGGTQQYEAIYHDGENGGNGQDVTASASWYSGNTGIATVIATGSSGGLATGVSQGTTGITAAG